MVKDVTRSARVRQRRCQWLGLVAAFVVVCYIWIGYAPRTWAPLALGPALPLPPPAHAHRHSPETEAQGSTAASETEEPGDWGNVVKKRLNTVKAVCSKHRLDLKEFHLFKTLTLDVQHSIGYCRNAKAGTSTILTQMLAWRGLNLPATVLHEKSIQILPYSDPLSAKKRIRNGSLFTFTFARHPQSRLVSAYRDKFIYSDERNTYITYLRNYRKKQMLFLHNKSKRNLTDSNNAKPTAKENDIGLIASDPDSSPITSESVQAAELLELDARYFKPQTPTFAEFISMVTHILRNGERVNVHWMPHHRRCAPCDVHYDFIGKMETFAQDAMYLSNITGLPFVATKIHMTNQSSSESLVRSYFSTLSEELKYQFYHAYYYDFILFGYEYKDYT